MFFEFTSNSLLNIEADTIFLIKRSEDQAKMIPKGKKVIIKNNVATEDQFIKFIDEIVHEAQSEYEKIIIPVIGKPFGMQDNTINDWVAGIVSDKKNKFLGFVVNPHRYRLKKIIFQILEEQYEDLIKKIKPVNSGSIEKKISFILDSLKLKNTQEAVCTDYHINQGRFVQRLQEFCNENKNRLEDRIKNTLKQKYGNLICHFPENLSCQKAFLDQSGLPSIKNFINESFPEIFDGIRDDLDRMEDIIWRLNIRMGAGKKLFHYIAHLVPERLVDDKNRLINERNRIANLAPEDIEKEVFDHYGKLVSKIQKIKLLNKILDDNSGEHIFPINQLKYFWEEWDRKVDSKRAPSQKTILWGKIISDDHAPGDIVAEKLGEYYDKSPDTIKGYCHKRV